MGEESSVVVVVVEEEVEEAMANWVCRVEPRVHEIVTKSAVLHGSR